MNDSIKALKGSAYRDAVKVWHKNLGTGLYTCDIDLAMVCFHNNPVPAILDVKKIGDNCLSATHKQIYDWFVDKDVPVYLITPIHYKKTKCEHCEKDDIVIDDCSDVRLSNYSTGEVRMMTRDEYIAWEKEKRRG